MRFLMKVSMPTDTMNKVIKKGKLGDLMKEMLAVIKPEAAYFTTENGQRSATLS